MKLKHLNLTTTDVAGLAAFFERFFAFRRLLERGSGAFTILGNDDDFVLTLMKTKASDPAYPETFHLGFYVDDRAAVEAKRDELLAAGLSPQAIREAGRSGRGAHFYCTAPGDVLVEVATAPELEAA
jgi:catechol 2,3-dioxygenase-like lactoylglutathione lyase family enzyme